MEKAAYYRVCYAACVLSAAGFAVRLAVDFIRYNASANSAPFSLWILADCAQFLLPALLFCILGKFLKKKYAATQKDEQKACRR